VGELLQLALNSIEFLWPIRRVQPWERGLYIVCGRWVREVGPGIYLMLPWFIEVRSESTVLALISTPRQDITLTDGKMLTFATTSNVRITDLRKAYLEVEAYHQTAQENIAAVLAEKLAEVDAARVTADKRGRLLSDLKKWVNAETDIYGVTVERLRFTTFVVNAKTFRLLQESGAVAPW
jgi:regulator of protease activity HflC (stomatin/prohibitin superfamily)